MTFRPPNLKADSIEAKMNEENHFFEDQAGSYNPGDWLIKTEEIDVSDVEFPDDSTDNADLDGKSQAIETETAGDPDSFLCTICWSSFREESELTIHQASSCARSLPPVCETLLCLACDKCQHVCATRAALQVHMLSHRGSEPGDLSRKSEPLMLTNKCEICSKEFTNPYVLKEHMTIHTGLKPYKCEICTKKFRLEKYLTEHMTVHSHLKPFECEVCADTFRLRNQLTKHMKTHSHFTPYECDMCAMKFTLEKQRAQHMTTHFGLKPFQCEICDKKYRLKSQLKDHMTVHSGVKPFVCEVCGKKYRCKQQVKGHMRTHTGLKPFECQVCAKKYGTKGELVRHMAAHAASKPIEFEFVAC